MDDFLLLGLLAIAALLLGPIAFFMTLGARSRLRDVEQRLKEAETRLAEALRTGAVARGPVAAPAVVATPPVAESAPVETEAETRIAAETAAPEPEIPIAAATAAPSETLQSPPATEAEPVAAPAPAPPRRSLEERLGARWTVWVGGVALALGALLLVRYSIEQGFFGPGMRIVMGLALAATLVGVGEFLRRRERDEPTPPGALSIPAMLTAAGTVAAFGTIYAAHALYGFIGPAPAFVLLGATGIACMFAAALHGPALAGLGLVAALATPPIVQSDIPNPWPVVPYVAIVTGAAYGLARIRLWLWLAISAAIGGGVWSFVFLTGVESLPELVFAPGVAHTLIQAAMACFVFCWLARRDTADADAQPDRLTILPPAAFAAMMALILANVAPEYFGTVWMIGVTGTIVLLSAAAVFVAPAAALSGVAGLLAVAAICIWPNASAPDVMTALRFAVFAGAPPTQPGMFAIFAIVWVIIAAGAAGWRLFFGPRLPLLTASIYAGVAALTPLAALSVAWMRFPQDATGYTFAALAAATGAVFVVLAHLFRERLAGERLIALDLGLGAFASGAIAALALALVFALSGGVLTVALALSALGAAFVAVKLDIPALRWCVAAFGVAVAARLAWEPRIVGAALGDTPVFNWLLFGYGIPAAAFGYAARLMRRASGVEDMPVKIAQSLAILFSAFLVFFEIRHAMNGGNPYARTSRLIEHGLFAVSAFGFAIVLTRLDAARTNIVFRFASLAFGVASFVMTIVGLGVTANPLFTNAPLEGGAIFNALLLAYLLPAMLAYALARAAENVRPNWYVMGARIATILLVFGWLTLQTRRLFRGADDMGLFGYIFSVRSMSQAEFWAYSAVWLGFGILLLAYGLLRGSREARMASAIFVFLSVLKVFVFDLAGLEGIVRALSFIGLGAILICIGLVYQKFVFAPRKSA